ncbi:hypothetical protein GJ496_006823 [Pomphorhynchus laevis]|nr:hypothetical protein GJ496_006823 [Pomphorhynchus laevis]
MIRSNYQYSEDIASLDDISAIVEDIDRRKLLQNSVWYIIDIKSWTNIKSIYDDFKKFKDNLKNSRSIPNTSNDDPLAYNLKFQGPIDVSDILDYDKKRRRMNLFPNEYKLIPDDCFFKLISIFNFLPRLDWVINDQYKCLKSNLGIDEDGSLFNEVNLVRIKCQIGKDVRCTEEYFSRYQTLTDIYQSIVNSALQNDSSIITAMPQSNKPANIHDFDVYRLTEPVHGVWEKQDKNKSLLEIGLGSNSTICFDTDHELSRSLFARSPNYIRNIATNNNYTSIATIAQAANQSLPVVLSSTNNLTAERPQSSKLNKSHLKTSLSSTNEQQLVANYRPTLSTSSSQAPQQPPIYRRPLNGLCGLKNIGNTCFLNSSVQCLSNVPMFRDYFIEKYNDILLFSHKSSLSPPNNCSRTKQSQNGALSLIFANLMIQMWTNGKSAGDTRELKHKISRISSRFSGFTQHDSQEFMCVLLDSLHEDLKDLPPPPSSQATSEEDYLNDCDKESDKIMISNEDIQEKEKKKIFSHRNSSSYDGILMSKYNQQKLVEEMSDNTSCPDSELSELFWNLHLRSGNSIVIQTFQGQIKSTVQCLDCYHFSRTFDPFIFLCLPITVDRFDGLVKCKSGLRRSSSPVTYKPNVSDAELILFGALITMDGLVHNVAICLQNRKNISNSNINNNRINDDNQSLLEDDNDTLLSLSTGFVVKDVLKSAEESTIFIDTASYHHMPRIKLVQSKTTCEGISYFDLVSINDSLSDIIEKCTFNECYVNMDGTADQHRRFHATKNALCYQVKLRDGILFYQHSPAHSTYVRTDTECGVTFGKHQQHHQEDDFLSIVTIRNNQGVLFPLMMSSTSLRSEFPDATTTEFYSNKDDSNAISSVKTLASRVLHSLNLSNSSSKQIHQNHQEQGHRHMEQHPEQHNKQRNVNHLYYNHTQEHQQHNHLDYHNEQQNQYNNVRYFLADCKITVSNKNTSKVNINEVIGRIFHKRGCRAPLPYLGGNTERGESTVTLYQCLSLFTETELLAKEDNWYCPVCKKKCQSTKKMDIYNLPTYLLIQLKRFKQNIYYREKLTTFVEYPLNGLDFKNFLPKSRRNQSWVYDLVAVSNHMGTLSNGHYTACAQNSIDNNWYCFDDSHVQKISFPERSVINSNGYILVYKCRSSSLTKRSDT